MSRRVASGLRDCPLFNVSELKFADALSGDVHSLRIGNFDFLIPELVGW